MERFWRSVSQSPDPDGCWEWSGARTAAGYGELMIDGQMHYAHRLSLELAGTPISDGLVVDHLCRNRACVRPDHLEPVTNRENILRGTSVSAINAAKDRCPSGHSYDEQNTWRNARGERYCRQCRREYDTRNRERIRARERARYQERKPALVGGA